MSSRGVVASGSGKAISNMPQVASRESWQREVERQAWMLQKEQRRAALREERRTSNKLDREVEKLLSKEDARIEHTRFNNSVMGDIVTDGAFKDGAGLEWKWDEKTRWWWWLDEDGKWQSKGRSWTRLLPKKAQMRSDRRQSDASDAASEPPSESGASSVSTAPTLTWPKSDQKVVVQKQRPCAWDRPLPVATAQAPAPTPAPAPTAGPIPAAAQAQAQPTHAEHSLAEVPTELEGQSLSHVVATIRGELGLDHSLTMAEVIAKANFQLGKAAEGNLAKQARSLLREITH